MNPLIVTSGEPAGIGPDICLSLAKYGFPMVVAGDPDVLLERAKQLGQDVLFTEYKSNESWKPQPNKLCVLPIRVREKVFPGQLNSKNSSYVLDMLARAIDLCRDGTFSALVTAPVHKAVINQAGFHFTGHTEFLAERCGIKTVVMMLACDVMKVALVTTHLPLQAVSKSVTIPLVKGVIEQVNQSMKSYFKISSPCIMVSGLNPHAGEGGYLGREEIDIISPAIHTLQQKGIDVQGPYPADTLFTPTHLKQADVFVTMYHDQGLPVLKYAGFGSAVNITLGLPIIRTSVDHGTALDLAGLGLAEDGSMQAAVKMALTIAKNTCQ